MKTADRKIVTDNGETYYHTSLLRSSSYYRRILNKSEIGTYGKDWFRVSGGIYLSESLYREIKKREEKSKFNT